MKTSAPAQQVYEFIKNKIAAKELFPGNRIVEEDISGLVGVSRTPIRAALMKLSYEGLVELQPNRGAFVARPSPTDLRQMCEVRTQLELGAFRRAIQIRSDRSVESMAENLRMQRELSGHFNMVEYVNLNRAFHWIIATECDNSYYEKYLNEVHNKVSTYLLFWDNSTTNTVSLEIHGRIFEAFRDRDGEKGEKAIHDDMQASLLDINLTHCDL